MQPDIAGTWHNQHGSELRLALDDEGLIRGHFRSAVGFPSGDEDSRVTGFVNGGLVSFIVEFSHHDCLTAWVGHRVIQDGRECLETLWHMVGTAPESRAGTETWRSIWSGADLFRRGPAEARRPEGGMPSHPTGYRGERQPPR